MISLLIISQNQSQSDQYLSSLIDKDDNIFETKPANKEYSIKDIREIIHETSIYNKRKRIYLLKNFHNSSVEAQNAFLKLLEEPPSNVQFILTTDNEYKLLSTIRSRVKTIKLANKQNSVTNNIDPTQLEKSLFHNKFKFLLHENLDLDKLIYFFYYRLRNNDKKAAPILKQLLITKTFFDKNNVNQQLAIDHILVLIKKMYKL